MRARILAAVLPALLAACTLEPPTRAAPYDFRLMPENLVFHWTPERAVFYAVEPEGALQEYVRSGLALWQDQLVFGELRTLIVTNAAGADVHITMDNGAPPAGTLTNDPPVNACQGVTSYPPLTATSQLSGPLEVRLQWFAGFNPNDIANCLSRVAAHEIGHTLGLLQHSDQAGDMMFGAPYGALVARTLSSRDRSTIEALYHTPPGIRPVPR